jgi:hypothetical protein
MQFGARSSWHGVPGESGVFENYDSLQSEVADSPIFGNAGKRKGGYQN